MTHGDSARRIFARRARLAVALTAAGWLGGMPALRPALAQERPRSPETRVMSSAAGWLPSEAQVDAALRLASRFLSAQDSEDYEKAYGMMWEGLQAVHPLQAYRQSKSAFNRTAGPVKERRFVRVTWYNDVPGSPPGVYAAIDLVSRFEKVDHHCGYLVLHQISGGFAIARQEETFMDRDTARKIEAESSKDEVERRWAKLAAAYCPS